MVSFLSNKRQCAIALTVVVLIMLVGLLPSANPVLADSAMTQGPPRRQLIIFLLGIVTSLSTKQANEGKFFDMMGLVPSTVREVFPEASIKPDASTRLLLFSYFSSRTDNGLPGAYNCADTVTNSITDDVRLLDKQIKNAFKVQPAGAEVDIYLIGHSLGGAVALAYLDFLQQKLAYATLPPHAHLKAVITLDSPIGGVAPGVFSSFTAFASEVLRHECQELDQQDPFTSPSDLVAVFNSTSVTAPEPQEITPHGARASFLVLHRGKLPTPVPSNGDLAEAAQRGPQYFGLGTSFLSVGNINDFLWNPKA